MTGGFAVDYEKVWDWILDLIEDNTFVHFDCHGNELVGILTFDGRSVGGRDEVLVGLKFPFVDDLGNTQSHSVVFPIGIYPGKDSVVNTEAIFDAVPLGGGKTLRQQIEAIRARANVEIRGESVTLTQHLVTDQKSMWALMQCCQGPKTNTIAGHKTEISSFCMCTNAPDDKANFDAKRVARIFSLFDPATVVTFCILHMKLRIVEKVFALTAVASVKVKKQGQLEQAICDLDVNMTIKKDDKGNLQITSLNGPDCEKLMAHVDTWLPAAGIKKDSEKYAKLWALFNTLYAGLNGRYPNGPSVAVLSTLRKQQKEFGAVFTQLFLRREIAPYVHLLVEHSVDHLERF
jgi:hypothetical protein